jgi:hypothetical protein
VDYCIIIFLQFLIFNFSCEFSIFIEATSGTRPEFVTVTVTDFTGEVPKGWQSTKIIRGLVVITASFRASLSL